MNQNTPVPAAQKSRGQGTDYLSKDVIDTCHYLSKDVIAQMTGECIETVSKQSSRLVCCHSHHITVSRFRTGLRCEQDAWICLQHAGRTACSRHMYSCKKGCEARQSRRRNVVKTSSCSPTEIKEPHKQRLWLKQGPFYRQGHSAHAPLALDTCPRKNDRRARQSRRQMLVRRHHLHQNRRCPTKKEVSFASSLCKLNNRSELGRVTTGENTRVENISCKISLSRATETTLGHYPELLKG